MNIDLKIKRIINKLLKRTREVSGFKEINYDSLVNLLKSNLNVMLVDVRSPQEFAENSINFAINIPLYDIQRKANVVLPNKDDIIVLYCQSGERSRKACGVLGRLGYTNLYNLRGGLENI